MREGELPQLPRLTHNLRASRTSRALLATTFLVPISTVSRCWKSGTIWEPTYSPDIRAQRSFRMPRETFRLRVPTTYAVSICPAGIAGGRHIGSDATTIFDSFVPAMNFRVVASSMLPRSIARTPGLVMARDMSRCFFQLDSTPFVSRNRYSGMRPANVAII